MHDEYYVYIMASASGVLYTGVTNDIERRVGEHKTHAGDSFSAKYSCHRLVHVEQYHDIRQAIEREKQIKKWSRMKKAALIETENPLWKDLSLGY